MFCVPSVVRICPLDNLWNMQLLFFSNRSGLRAEWVLLPCRSEDRPWGITAAPAGTRAQFSY